MARRSGARQGRGGLSQGRREHTPPPVGEVDRGREARSPAQIPPRGWKDVVSRVRQDIKDDQIGLVAAGVAYYSMLALFPALIAAISVYGLMVGPEEAADQARQLTEVMPEAAANLIGEQLTNMANTRPSSLTLGLVISVLLALWSASNGMKALITGVNIAYNEDDSRGFLKLRGLALLLTIGAIVVFCLAIGAIAVFPAVADRLPGSDAIRAVFGVGRWVFLALVILAALAVLYRVAPDRENARMKWVSVGAVVATVGWLAASIGFSIYADNFSSYNQTYGSLAAVIILLFWLFISAFVILIGAELNGQAELQTRRDTTTGPERPLGERGAYVADEVAPATRRR